VSVRHLRPPLAAVAFLTRVPVGRLLDLDARDVARSAPLFPLVGGAIGALAGLVAGALAGPLPPLAAGTLAVGLAAVLTGGLHLDALADAADALGARTAERALEIMRDHAIGAFGATALVLVLLLDAAVLGGLGAEGDAVLAGLAAGACSRAVVVPLAAALPPVRPGEGQARILAGAGVARAAAALALGAALALPAGWAGAAAVAVSLAVAALLGLFYRRWLGGVTGDLLGAAVKLSESAALVAALAVAG
jgi:adenosylcobinamide-GDP ribazoletransferase